MAPASAAQHIDRKRVPYAVAAGFARAALRRAATMRLSTKDHRVLEAVIAQTALYSRLWDRCYLAELAAHAHGVEWAEPWMLEKTRKSLVRLREAGLIFVVPPRGRPAGGTGPAYFVGLTSPDYSPDAGCDTGEEDSPDAGCDPMGSQPDPVENPARSRPGTQPGAGGPTEKKSEKKSEERARRGDDVLVALLAGDVPALRRLRVVQRGDDDELDELLATLVTEADGDLELLHAAYELLLAAAPAATFVWPRDLKRKVVDRWLPKARELRGEDPSARRPDRPACPECHGTTHGLVLEPGMPPLPCDACAGTGRLREDVLA